MEPQEQKPRLIRNRRTAAIALCCTGLIAVQSFRSTLVNTAHSSHWLVPLNFMAVPVWLLVLVNLAFYGYLLWIGLKVYRVAQGMERVVVVGWFDVIFLGFVQNLVSTPQAAAIQSVKAAGMTLAFLAVAYIFFKNPAA